MASPSPIYKPWRLYRRASRLRKQQLAASVLIALPTGIFVAAIAVDKSHLYGKLAAIGGIVSVYVLLLLAIWFGPEAE